MSKADQFWQYAKEAMLSVPYAKTDEDRQVCSSLLGPGRKRHYWSGRPQSTPTARLKPAPRSHAERCDHRPPLGSGAGGWTTGSKQCVELSQEGRDEA